MQHKRGKIDTIHWKSVPRIDNTNSKVWSSNTTVAVSFIQFVGMASSLPRIIELEEVLHTHIHLTTTWLPLEPYQKARRLQLEERREPVYTRTVMNVTSGVTKGKEGAVPSMGVTPDLKYRVTASLTARGDTNVSDATRAVFKVGVYGFKPPPRNVGKKFFSLYK